MVGVAEGDEVVVSVRSRGHRFEERGVALIGADGLWSKLRRRLGDRSAPRFARHTAWRSLAASDMIGSELRDRAVNLWFGRDAHVVHYPVRAGSLVNVVAFFREDWREPGWSVPADPAEILARYPPELWPAPVRAFLSAPVRWHKWALFDRAPLPRWGEGPVTLLGDAAHPMLPFLGQGAANAIEDAMILTRCLEGESTPELAFALYQRTRHARVRTATEQAARRGDRYLGEPNADSLKGNEPGAEYAYDAVSGPLGG